MERLNIYHRKDGRWEGRISRGKKDNGQRKLRYIFGWSVPHNVDKILQP